jgi:LysM repeat protein
MSEFGLVSPRSILNWSSLLTVAFLISACSSGINQPPRTRLTGPADAQYNLAPPQQLTRYDASPSNGMPSPNQSSNCRTEPVARPPYPAYIVVSRGENLCRIAKRYQTTVQAIVDANRLASPNLPVGMRLRLPSPQYYSQSPYGQLRTR